MSLSMSQGEGVTVFTITSNPKSNWPILCQILGNLCPSPPCLLPKDVKRKMTYISTALGIVQIIIGILNIVSGILFTMWGIHDYIMLWDSPFWLGGVFLVSGIISIVVICFEGYGMYALALILNEACAVLAMVGVALYSWDLVKVSCKSASDYPAALTPDLMETDSFLDIKMSRGPLDIIMIILTILQFCANITYVTSLVRACVVEDDDSQLHKLLPEEITGNLEC